MSKSKRRKQIYSQDHIVAKLLTWAIGLPLLWYLVDDHSLTTMMVVYSLHFLYYFGINTIGHILDIFRGFKTLHRWL